MSNRISRSAAKAYDEPMKFRLTADGRVELVTDFAGEELVDPRLLGELAIDGRFDTMIHMEVYKKLKNSDSLGKYRASYRVVGWDDSTGAFKVRLVGTPVRR